MLETLKMDCPDSIEMGVRNESEWVSGMDRNHCPEWIGMGVRNGAEYAFFSGKRELLPCERSSTGSKIPPFS